MNKHHLLSMGSDVDYNGLYSNTEALMPEKFPLIITG